ncbi:MAG: M16 family metallopeptidase [Actinomycetes bacterium]
MSNGINVLTYSLPGQYVVSAHLVLDLPLNSEDRSVEGVATICARTLDEGTRRHGGEEFAALLETEGAGFGIDVSLSGVQAMVDVPVSRLDRALSLFGEAVTEPALANSDVNRHVQLRLAEIEQAEANSSQVASIAFRSAVFDERSRASRMSFGESETVAAVTPETVRTFHQTQFGPERSTLVLAGDFSAATGDPAALAESVLGAWPAGQRPPVVPETPQRAPRRAVLVDRPGAVQADVRLGGFGVDRSDPRWADLTVASYAVGGGFLSRLNAVLREEKGYTYGVRLTFSPLRVGGYFAVQGSFRTEVVGDALRLARELLRTEDAPLTPSEVADAVSYHRGVSPLRYATADGVADQAATQVLTGLKDDYLDAHLAALARVTPESAAAAYESVVAVEDLTLVVVGDADRVADPVRRAGFPDLEIMTA